MLHARCDTRQLAATIVQVHGEEPVQPMACMDLPKSNSHLACLSFWFCPGLRNCDEMPVDRRGHPWICSGYILDIHIRPAGLGKTTRKD